MSDLVERLPVDELHHDEAVVVTLLDVVDGDGRRRHRGERSRGPVRYATLVRNVTPPPVSSARI
jgi:hypothetical protein